MKKLFLSLLIFMWAQVALAADVTLVWDPNPPEEHVTGYIVYWGSESRTVPGFGGYEFEVDVGNVTEKLLDIGSSPGARFFAAIAYNEHGLRSDYSDELILPAMTRPARLRFKW